MIAPPLQLLINFLALSSSLVTRVFGSLYYSWSKEFLQAGKKRLAGDTSRQATRNEVKLLRAEARDLKEALAEQMLENRLLKKSMIGDGGDEE